VGAVIIRDGRQLMVRRAHEPNKGRWSIPGGLVELGETLREAAAREVLEECSLKVEITRVLDGVDNIVRDKDGRIRYHYVITDLLGRYAGGEIKAQSDAAACRWVPLAAIEKLDVVPVLRDMLKRNGIV
jgi:8-oxo-dGTP diphosphatase